MLLESQYDQFREEVEYKPKGGIAFITDIDRKKLLAIADGGSDQNQSNNGSNFGTNKQGNNNKRNVD